MDRAIDTFNEVPIFVAVAEAGGFAIAARRLNLSRSAVSKSVARLEGRFRAQLFHRTTRSLSLTEDGQVFFEHCQRALGELRTGVARFDSGRRTARGRLRVSMPALLGRLCVAPVLIRLPLTHPELELDLSFSDRPVDLVEDGFDLAVRHGALRGGIGLMSRRILRQRAIVCASPAYLERHGAPDALEGLSRHRAITYARNGDVHPWLFPRDDGPPKEFTPPSRLRFDDLGVIADATAAGLGLAWLPDWLVRDRIKSGELLQVLHDAPPLVSDNHVIWPETSHLQMRVRVAIDALAAEMPRCSEERPVRG